jgi:hypothetical protein
MDLSMPMEQHEGALQIVMSGATVWAINKLKGFESTKWVTDHSRMISVAIATLTSIGFTMTLDGSLLNGGALTIDFPGLMTVFAHVTSGSIGQHYMYQIVKAIDQNKELKQQGQQILDAINAASKQQNT